MKINLLGRVVRDVELQSSKEGKPYANFTVVENLGKDKSNFMTCIAFGKTAEFISKYFTKGKPIYIDGSLEKTDWVAKDGTKRYDYNIIVSNVTFVPQESKENIPTSTEIPTVVVTDNEIKLP